STARRSGRVSISSGNIRPPYDMRLESLPEENATGRAARSQAGMEMAAAASVQESQHLSGNRVRNPLRPHVLLGLEEVAGRFGRIGLVLVAIDEKRTDLGIGQTGLGQVGGDGRRFLRQPGC